MNRGRAFPAGLSALVCLACCAPAAAVIKVELPVSRMYETAEVVLLATIERVQADNRVLDARVRDTLKGRPMGERLRVQLAEPAGLIRQVHPGRPIVLFAGRSEGKWLAVVHLADTWLQAERIPNAEPPAWRVNQVRELSESFPGRTAALARMARCIKARRGDLLDKVERDFFCSGVRELARLDLPKASTLLAVDVDRDGKADLLVGSAQGVRLLLAGASGYADVTAKWGLARAGGPLAASGDADGDGRPDLLLGTTLWLNAGRTFTDAGAGLKLPADARPLAAALVDATGDKRPDAVVLLADGRLLAFGNPAQAGKPWRAMPVQALWKGGDVPAAALFGDWADTGVPHVMVVRDSGLTCYPLQTSGEAPLGDERLIGRALGTYYKAQGGRLRNVLATAVEANGDKRPDIFLLAEGGASLLVNRGFEAFFVLLGSGTALTAPDPPGRALGLDRPAALAAADVDGDGLEDLLVLTRDGRVCAAANAETRRHP